ncbi:MAG: NrsF family protein [Bryobacteraceae bacterium]
MSYERRQVDERLEPVWNARLAPPESLVAAISGRVCRDLRTVKPVPSPTGIAARLFLVVVLTAMATGSLVGLGGLGHMSWTQRLLISAALAAGAAVLTLSLGWQAIPGSLQRYSPLSAALLALGSFLASVAALFPLRQTEAAWETGFRCTRGGLGLALPAAFLIWLVIRRGAAQSHALTGTTIGATAGLVSVAALQFHCDQQEMAHLSIWHGVVVILSGFSGFVVGSAVRRWGPAERI